MFMCESTLIRRLFFFFVSRLQVRLPSPAIHWQCNSPPALYRPPRQFSRAALAVPTECGTRNQSHCSAPSMRPFRTASEPQRLWVCCRFITDVVWGTSFKRSWVFMSLLALRGNTHTHTHINIKAFSVLKSLAVNWDWLTLLSRRPQNICKEFWVMNMCFTSLPNIPTGLKLAGGRYWATCNPWTKTGPANAIVWVIEQNCWTHSILNQCQSVGVGTYILKALDYQLRYL